MTEHPPAGWYDDGTGKQRWWNGERWTEEFIDLRETQTQLHHDSGVTSGAAAAPGWYDDQRGRERWWNGTSWTEQTRPVDDEQVCAGIAVGGRWIHFGARSQRVGDVEADAQTGAVLLSHSRMPQAATQRRLFGPGGLISPQRLARSIDRATTYVVITSAAEVWIAPLPPAEVSTARQFVGWVNACSRHYRHA